MDISKDFLLCIEKLLSSIMTLHKYLPNNEKILTDNEQANRKLQTIKDAIISLGPAVKTASQFNSTSILIERLTNEYARLCEDFKTQSTLFWSQMPAFHQYKQTMEDLSTWLNTTNETINEVLQTGNKERIIFIVNNLDELNKYKVLLKRAIELNQTMIDDLVDEQARKMNDEIDHVKQEWRMLIDGLKTFRERYSLLESTSSEQSTSTHANLIFYLENWLAIARQLLIQFEQIDSHSSLDLHQLLSQFRECEEELNRLKNLFDNISASEVTHTSVEELKNLVLSVLKARIELENRIDINFQIESLKNFIEKPEHLDKNTIQLYLNEKKTFFEEISQLKNPSKQINSFIEMWSYLSSLTTDSPSEVTTQSSSTVPFLFSRVNEQAYELLNTNVQLGNRQDIEQLKTKIQNILFNHQQSILSEKLCNDLANRQLILEQMLIDTAHIDHLRVNFVAHFNTENNVRTATNEINTLIENYPREMTSQLRQWFNEQQRTREKSKCFKKFEEYLDELENLILQANQNQFQKLVQLAENPPNLPDIDKQRCEQLQSRYVKLQLEIEDLKTKNLSIKSNIDKTIANIDVLITHLRDIELQIHDNEKQPFQEYERLIVDCQRIILELNQNLRLSVEQAINTGKRLYSSDSKDSSEMESADENGGITSISPYPSLKRHSDFTLRKVRRHVLQLSQYWKNANNNVQSRLKILQRIQTAVEDLRRKCDQLHAHLLEIELACAHQPQIKSLNTQQIPTEIEQAKTLLTTLMSCKPTIDDIQQSAQTVENEYDIQMINRAEELNQRWEHSVSVISQRIQSLQDTVRNTETDIYSNSVEQPWQRAIAVNKIPYYINHSDQTTSWDHPKMLELMRSFSNLNDIRFSAYRTAMKLRTLQKRLCLDLTSLSNIITVFEGYQIVDSLNKNIDVNEILDYLQKIFEKTSQEYPQLVNIILTVDLILNWLLNIYDTNRTGSIRLISMKIALALLCRGNIEEKYRYIFSLVTYENEGRNVVDRQRLSVLFQQAIVIPKQLGEVAAFGGSSVEPSVQSCFEFVQNPEFITAEDFLEWVKLEPQSLVWLPVMHRLAASEAAKHEARCNICKIYPILGFRYRSLRYFNCDICQNCFFSGKQTKIFKMDHPLQEYYTETTSSEDIRDFFRIFKNKFLTKHRKSPKLGYLPLPHVFDNTLTINDSQVSSSSPLLIPTSTSSRVDDEHGVIAQHCRTLTSVHLNNDQRNELEAIIHDLEDENRALQQEYERLCQEHMEKSLIINEQQEQMEVQDREMLREAKQLRQHKIKLEQRMKILEEHNKQLEKQLKKSKQLLVRDEDQFSRSTDRNLERQNSNLHTIDNLFDMANDINRAVGDLVSVMTEPQSTTSTTHPSKIVT